MANTTIKLKRTSVAGKVPNTVNLPEAGELAINLTDQILYSTNGSVVFEIGANNTTVSVTNTLSIGSNVVINTSAYFVGNSTVNTQITSTQVNTDIVQLDVAAYVGDNVSVLETGFYVGNSTVNASLNSTALSVKSIVANGNIGSSGQALFSNGTHMYWESPGAASVDQDAQYNWTNTHTFSNTITFGNTSSNAVINSTVIKISNSTSNTQITIPTSAEWSGQYFLHANGTWAQVVSVSVAGSNTEIQFNENGVFSSNIKFTFDYTTTSLSVGNTFSNSSTVRTEVGFMNKKTLDYNYTYPNTYNTVITGPFTVTSGITMTIENGARVSIV